MLKAYSYLRFSHKCQATGDSVRRQTDLASDWCGRNGAVLDDALTYRDLGVSAFRGKNAKEGALSLFLDAVERGRVPPGSFLIIENLDRLTRAEFFTAIEIVGKILRAGIRLVTLFPEQVLTADDADDSKIMYVVMSLMRGHQESALKAKRLRDLWAERRKQNSKLGNLCPSWLKYDKEGNKYRVDRQKAKTVRLLFDLAAQGMGQFQICRHLHTHDIPNLGRGKRGWNTSYISLILRNRAVLGERQPCRVVNGKRVPEGEPVADFYPPVIDVGLFHRVQDGLRSRKGHAGFRGRGARKLENLFAGLLKDARDGGTMAYYRGRKCNHKKVWLHLASYNALRKRGEVPLVAFPYQIFETAFLLSMKEMTRDDFFPSDHEDVTSEVDSQRGTLAELKVKIDSLHEKVLNGGNLDAVLPLLEKLEERRRETETEINRLLGQVSRREEDSLTDLQQLIDEMDKLPEAERHDVRERVQAKIRQLTDTVWVLFSNHKAPRDNRKPGYQYDRKAIVEIHFRNGHVRQYHVLVSGKHAVYSSPIEGEKIGIRLTDLPKSFDRRNPSQTIVRVDSKTREVLI